MLALRVRIGGEWELIDSAGISPLRRVFSKLLSEKADENEKKNSFKSQQFFRQMTRKTEEKHSKHQPSMFSLK